MVSGQRRQLAAMHARTQRDRGIALFRAFARRTEGAQTEASLARFRRLCVSQEVGMKYNGLFETLDAKMS